MAMRQILAQKQAQTLSLTPQLRQSLKILELNSLDLMTYLQQEMESNPFLSLELPEESNFQSSDTTSEGSLEHEYLRLDHGSSHFTNNTNGSYEDENDPIQELTDTSKSLRDILETQIRTTFTDPLEIGISLFLADSLDTSGYLTEDVSLLAQQIGTSESEIERLLHILKTFEPVGIFSKDLAESLTTQLSDQKLLSDDVRAVVDNLELVAKGKMEKLMQIAHVPKERIQAIVQLIKSLNPSPAFGYAHQPIQHVIPDLLMRNTPSKGWEILVNPQTLPKILVHKKYYAELKSSNTDEASKTYIQNCYNTATYLEKALHQRISTLLNVATQIFDRQKAFLTEGILALKPLVLKDIALELGMHESTISRATNHKFIQTPRGTFELKYFFSQGLGTSDGEDISSSAAKFRIKQLIEAENPERPLSDDKLVTILQNEGLKLARRTVSKYREAMHIPSSFQRKRI